MEKFEKHVLLNNNTVIDYVLSKLEFFDINDELEAFEIGDGNINYVFQVKNKKNGRSIIVKQADKYLRSSGRPLDVKRNKIEAEILKIEGNLAKGYVPEIYYYDEKMCVLMMEDISAYKNLRKELINGVIYEGMGIEIANFLAKTLLPTTDLIMGRTEKKENVKKFCNIELCDITEDLVLCEPYYNYKNRNIITKENQKFVEDNIYNNNHLKCEVLKLRNKYMNEAQALIHGDLHSGSIFINSEGIKVIDPEFAFYGPMGYDIGNVIGNLMFAWVNKKFLDSNNEKFLLWIETEINNVIYMTIENLNILYNEKVTFELYKEKEFKEYYLSRILSDSLGYAGTEIIRRVVGDSKVLEITGVTNLEDKLKIEQALLKIGIYLIFERDNIKVDEDIFEKLKIIVS